ncbi:MAG: 4-aminobutyrate--2-oxoglutarate transaminase [Caldilinea sp.]|nr:4-aminobutyrate--2-oxoglutarate transaminase [Caldilinea sp.]MDW8439108.1 4-aminobutyrate--2-oxoglutarate transaminase [Caldilineaceae bacterium]
MATIHVQPPLPGPKSRAILARRDAAVSKASFRSTPVVAASAHGAAVTDVDGNTFLDFTAGIGTLNVGHTPTEVVEAIRSQAGDLIHLCAIVGSYEPYIALAEKLNALVPISGPKKTFLSNSGAEAVETAIKMARAYTGRPAIITYEGAYHGRTLLTLSLTSKYALFKKGFGPFAPEIYRVPYPYSYRCPHCRDAGVCNLTCFEDLERALITQIDPSAVAALIIEPVQGEGGFIPASYEYLRKVRALCDKHGIVLIVDEVQAGFCRTGRWFSFEHSGIEPDLVVMAKSLAAGMPLAAVTGRAEIVDAPHLGGLGSTFGGNPVACVAALRAIGMMERDNLNQRAEQIGEITMAHFRRWKEQYPIIGDVRGLGAMTAIEFVQGRNDRTPNTEAPLKVVAEAYQRGLLLIRAGLYSNGVRTLVPLVITDEQLEEGLGVLEEAIRVAAG